MGGGALCGAVGEADDTAVVTPTGQPSFDELAGLAIAAGVARSEVARLSREHPNRGPLALATSTGVEI